MFETINIFSDLLEVPWEILILILIWSLTIKGFALWKAGRKNNPIWFIALLLINTLGILDLLYIFFFSEKSNSKKIMKKELSKKRSKSK